MLFYRPTNVTINLTKLIENYQFFKGAGSSFLCPMVKANAYGHGDRMVVEALAKYHDGYYGVGLVEEALSIQDLVPAKKILVFGFYGKESVKEILHREFTPVVSNSHQLALLQKYVRKPQNIHIKINTGMNRLGFTSADIPVLVDQLKQSQYLAVTGVCSHLLDSHDYKNTTGHTQTQLSHFVKLVDRYFHKVPNKHLYNSEAAFAIATGHLSKHQNFGLRPGLGLYANTWGKNGASPRISDVMTFQSKVIEVQELNVGDVVSYAGTWKASRKTTVGVVPAGYADGVPLSLSNNGYLVCQGQRCPVIGRVCMDYTLIDVSHIPSPEGAAVVFFGEGGATVKEFAAMADTTVYNIMTSISDRVPRQANGVVRS